MEVMKIILCLVLLIFGMISGIWGGLEFVRSIALG